MPTPTDLAKTSLLNLTQYVQDHPPQEPFVVKKTGVIYAHPFERLTLTLERTPDIGYGLAREERLAVEHRTSGSLEDSKAFAKDLYVFLEDHLSLRMLRDLTEVLNAGLTQEEEARQKALGARSIAG